MTTSTGTPPCRQPNTVTSAATAATTTTTSTASAAAATAAGNGSASTSTIDDILTNITRSNQRLASELAKIPPLPELYSVSPQQQQQQGRHQRAVPSLWRSQAICSCNSSNNNKCHCQRKSATSNLSLHKERGCSCWAGKTRPLSRSRCFSSSTPFLHVTQRPSAKLNAADSHSQTLNKLDTQQQQQQTKQAPEQPLPQQPQQQQQQQHRHTHELTVELHPQTPTNLDSTTQVRPGCATSGSAAFARVDTSTNVHFDPQCTKCTKSPNPKARYRAQAQSHAHNQCKTEPLPWLQQHLVLQQTVSGFSGPPDSLAACAACQDACQVELTERTASAAATARQGDCERERHVMPGGDRTRPHEYFHTRLKPQTYFEELLRRDKCCGVSSSSSNSNVEHAERFVVKTPVATDCSGNKKPRPPVKVDVNVRLVPRAPKQRAAKLKESSAAEARRQSAADVPELQLQDVQVEDFGDSSDEAAQQQL